MTEKLDTLLQQTLQKFLDGIQTTADFATAQVPDVINQLLTWYFIHYLLNSIFAVILFSLQIYVSHYWVIKIEPKINNTYKWMGTTLLVGVGGSFLLLGEILLFNLQWLKIWLAPKLWLIEYSAALIK